MTEKCVVTQMPHHVQQKLCRTRLPYRQGKKLTAVKVALETYFAKCLPKDRLFQLLAYQEVETIDPKSCQQDTGRKIIEYANIEYNWLRKLSRNRIFKWVYTINDESQHLLICGVPQLQLAEEVKKLVYLYGNVKAIQLVTEYPLEEFTETYHIHYTYIQSARIAKRSIDNKNFFGGILHVCYAPELETLKETKAKLIQRRKDVATQIKRIQQELMNPEIDKFTPKEQYHRRKKTPALPLTEERIKHCYPGETLSSICNGIPQSIDPRHVSEPRLPINWKDDYNSSIASSSKSFPTPYQFTEAVIQTGFQQANKNSDSNVRKRKNYKGHCIDNKVKVVRPRLIDTRNIARLNSAEKTNAFCNVKKVESGITIKLLEKFDNKKKKIIIKNPSVTSLIQSSKDLQSSIQAAKTQIRTIMQKHDT